MKILLFIIAVTFSLSGQASYKLPDAATPNYNVYFYRCVIHTDEMMFKLSDVFYRVKKDAALNAVREAYVDHDAGYRSLVEDMVIELYADVNMDEKLDKFFYRCLNVVNSLGIYQ